MVIEPGDLIIGDGDGVLAVPYAVAADVLAKTEAKQAAETKLMAQIAARTNDRSWIDDTLRRLGCPFPSA